MHGTFKITDMEGFINRQNSMSYNVTQFCIYIYIYIYKVKAVPLHAWSDPEGSRKLRYPDIMTTQNGGKVVSLKHRPPLPPRNARGTHFC